MERYLFMILSTLAVSTASPGIHSLPYQQAYQYPYPPNGPSHIHSAYTDYLGSLDHPTTYPFQLQPQHAPVQNAPVQNAPVQSPPVQQEPIHSPYLQYPAFLYPLPKKEEHPPPVEPKPEKPPQVEIHYIPIIHSIPESALKPPPPVQPPPVPPPPEHPPPVQSAPLLQSAPLVQSVPLMQHAPMLQSVYTVPYPGAVYPMPMVQPIIAKYKIKARYHVL